jgi:hypothetical protein
MYAVPRRIAAETGRLLRVLLVRQRSLPAQANGQARRLLRLIGGQWCRRARSAGGKSALPNGLLDISSDRAQDTPLS